MEIKEILEKLQKNELTIEQAEKEIKNNNYEDLGYAKIDNNRKERTGNSEVIFCQSKPDEFLTKIYTTIYKENGEVLGTRASKEQYELLRKTIPNIQYDNISRILKIEKEKELVGNIAICTGGTADKPVAEEAAQTAEFFENKVERIYDVGVAGMEGTLASVIGGLAKVPVIAVPTSVGYGANFGGLAVMELQQLILIMAMELDILLVKLIRYHLKIKYKWETY